MFAESTTIAAQLLAGIVRENGATVPLHYNDSVPTTGYAVGGIGTLKVHKSGLLASTVEAWVDSAKRGPVGPFRYVGAWRDGNDIYLDGVTIEADVEAAIALARQRGELAIFDLGRHVEIDATTLAGLPYDRPEGASAETLALIDAFDR